MNQKAFIVIAGRRDIAARDFAARYAGQGVCLMTPHDLSQSGWTYRVGDAANSTTIIGGRSLAARDVAAVLTRIPCVTADDLPHIASPDRGYVAAEMTAFLLAWLTELQCPCINRPTARCLSGPAWSQETWAYMAARIGIPTTVSHRHIRLPQGLTSHDRASDAPSGTATDAEFVTKVTIIGQQCIGTAGPNLKRAAGALAQAAGAELLVVRFGARDAGAPFVDAHYWPDLDDREIDAAMWRSLREAAH